MNSSIMMDIIISLVLVFAYYLYTRFDKESKELDIIGYNSWVKEHI